MARFQKSLPVGQTNEIEIAAFEEYICSRLPDDYRQFLLQHNGGEPVPNAFSLNLDGGVEEDTVMCLFPMRDISLGEIEVEELEQLRTWPLHCALADLRHDLVNLYQKELPEPLLPIGTDGAGNYLCLVLYGERMGSILFLEHEMADTILLASSFTKFIDSLRPSLQIDHATEARSAAMERACLQADDKFRKQNFKEVVALLSPYESELSAAASAKLKLARKKLTSK